MTRPMTTVSTVGWARYLRLWMATCPQAQAWPRCPFLAQLTWLQLGGHRDEGPIPHSWGGGTGQGSVALSTCSRPGMLAPPLD